VEAAGVLEGGSRGDGGGTVAGERGGVARDAPQRRRGLRQQYTCALSPAGSWGSKARSSIGLDRSIRRGEPAIRHRNLCRAGPGAGR
jgi:hypothetical protein